MMAVLLLSNIFLLFALTATLYTFYQNKGGLLSYVNALSTSTSTTSSTCTKPKIDATMTDQTCGATLKNSAFVFIKPHANTIAVQQLVRDKLMEAGCNIVQELSIDGKTIDDQKLIDQHYYAIASKATILLPKEIPVPKDKFYQSFGEEWDTVLSEGRACNAMQALEKFGCTVDELNDIWQKSTTIKFGGGFYCALLTYHDTSLYVFNAFFMTMRSKFVTPPTLTIYCYEITFDASQLSWSQFRNEILGPTDPKDGPPNSLRRMIYDNYESLGLSSLPNKGDNGVHASASPFEGLCEKLNWLQRTIEQDEFGKALLQAHISEETIKEWSVDPQVKLPSGSTGSIFDALEDMDATDCLHKLIEINQMK